MNLYLLTSSRIYVEKKNRALQHNVSGLAEADRFWLPETPEG